MKASAALTMGFLAAVTTALPGTASGVQPVGCLIEPDAVAEIGSPAPGIVQSVLVERGDRVTRGQVLAVLRNDVERAALDTARTRSNAKGEEGVAIASFELARQKLARSEELVRHRFISQQALEQAKAEYQMAEQRLAQAREQQSALANELALAKARLEDRNIRSPVDGIVTERYVWAGERVEDKPLLRVAKVQPLRVEVVMPGSVFGTVSTGMSGRILPDTRGGVPVEAKVSLVDQVVDAPSNTFRVRLRLANPDGTIPAGVRCRADLGDGNLDAKRAPGATPSMHDAGPLTLKPDRELASRKPGGAPAAPRKPDPAPSATRQPDPVPPAASRRDPVPPVTQKPDREERVMRPRGRDWPAAQRPYGESPVTRGFSRRGPPMRKFDLEWPASRPLSVSA